MALVAGQIPISGYQAPDYSAATAAIGAANAAPYQMISDLAGQAKDYFKQQGEKKKLVKQSSLQIDAALQLFPDLAPSLQSVKERMRDENIPLADRAAEAEVVANLINTGIGEMRDRSNRSFEQEKFAADQAYRQAGLGMQAAELGIRQQASQQAAESEAAKRSLKKIVVSTPLGEAELDVSVDSQGNPYDIQSGKRIGDLKNYATGEGAWEAPERNMPPTSQLNYDQLPSSNNFGFTSKTRDLLPKSTADARQVSLDFNAAPSKNAKGVEIIIPNNASAIERAAAMDYVNKTQQYFADRGVEVPVRSVRTAKENGRGTPGRFHTEPFFVGHAEARKVMESDPDGYAQVLADTLGRIPNVTFIAPHKTNDPGASDGKFNERDFAKGSIIPALERLSRGDLSKQAMGTPEQQAEVSRMIEQGAGMATSQAVLSGAMPTEPSMAAQQPQLPQQVQPAEQPRLARGRLLTGGAASSKFRPANAEEVSMYGTQGQVNVETGEFKPIRPPSGVSLRQLPGGGFEFVQGAGAVDRFAQASKEAEKQKLQAADRNIQDLMEVKRRYSSVMQSKGILPAAARKLEAVTPGTELYTIQNDLLKQFQSRLGLEQLTELRMASPSGAAVGNPTNEEGIRLQSKFGSLDATASPEIFKRNINRAIEDYLDTIHGTPEQREKLIEEGKITAKQNAEIEAQYPSSTMDTMGIEQPRQTGGTGNPAIDEIIQRNNIQIK
jgi:hypothetical protein